MKSKWRWWHTLLLIVFTGAILLTGFKKELPAVGNIGLLETWIIIAILLTLSLSIIGHGITGLLKGVLVDDRNMVSLSRFQTVLWTILILSALITAFLSNLAAGKENPLSIKIPEELWALMGISVTSLVGSPLIKSTKHSRDVHKEDEEAAKDQLKKKGLDEKKTYFKGQIVVYKEPEMASFSNLFEGEEAGNAARVDLAKVQMFYFTVILVLAYAVALGKMFASNTFITEFPSLDPSMIWLLGISHGGYLLHKAVPHTRPK